MNARFYLIILLICVLFGAWAFLAHNHGLSEQAYYEKLSRLPVYAYVADTTKVEPIKKELASVSAIKDVEHETGFQAAMELIDAYGLPLTDEMVADYQFPDILTVVFPAHKAGIEAKKQVMNKLLLHLDPDDIDSQSNAYNEIIMDLQRLSLRHLVFSIFAGLLLLLLFICSRLSYEMHIYLKQKRQLISIVDVMRHKKMNLVHSWMMLVIPVGLVCGGYYLGVYFERWGNYVAWWNFVLMAGLILVGTLVLYFCLRRYEQDSALNDLEPIEVTSKAEEEAEDA